MNTSVQEPVAPTQATPTPPPQTAIGGAAPKSLRTHGRPLLYQDYLRLSRLGVGLGHASGKIALYAGSMIAGYAARGDALGAVLCLVIALNAETMTRVLRTSARGGDCLDLGHILHHGATKDLEHDWFDRWPTIQREKPSPAAIVGDGFAAGLRHNTILGMAAGVPQKLYERFKQNTWSFQRGAARTSATIADSEDPTPHTIERKTSAAFLGIARARADATQPPHGTGL